MQIRSARRGRDVRPSQQTRMSGDGSPADSLLQALFPRPPSVRFRGATAMGGSCLRWPDKETLLGCDVSRSAALLDAGRRASRLLPSTGPRRAALRQRLRRRSRGHGACILRAATYTQSVKPPILMTFGCLLGLAFFSPGQVMVPRSAAPWPASSRQGEPPGGRPWCNTLHPLWLGPLGAFARRARRRALLRQGHRARGARRPLPAP
jgi:hypothetical protein